MEQLITVKATPEARRLLRLVAAMTEERQYVVWERLLRAELARLQEAQRERITVTIGGGGILSLSDDAPRITIMSNDQEAQRDRI